MIRNLVWNENSKIEFMFQLHIKRKCRFIKQLGCCHAHIRLYFSNFENSKFFSPLLVKDWRNRNIADLNSKRCFSKHPNIKLISILSTSILVFSLAYILYYILVDDSCQKFSQIGLVSSFWPRVIISMNFRNIEQEHFQSIIRFWFLNRKSRSEIKERCRWKEQKVSASFRDHFRNPDLLVHTESRTKLSKEGTSSGGSTPKKA